VVPQFSVDAWLISGDDVVDKSQHDGHRQGHRLLLVTESGLSLHVEKRALSLMVLHLVIWSSHNLTCQDKLASHSSWTPSVQEAVSQESKNWWEETRGALIRRASGLVCFHHLACVAVILVVSGSEVFFICHAQSVGCCFSSENMLWLFSERVFVEKRFKDSFCFDQ